MSEAELSPPAKPRRRWFQYSLRTLLFVVTLLSIVAAWTGRELHLVRQREAVARSLLDRGGKVSIHEISAGWEKCNDRLWFLSKMIDYKAAPKQDYDERVRLTKAKPAFPKVPWLRSLLGDRPAMAVFVSSSEVASVEQLFPEAIVTTLDSPNTSYIGMVYSGKIRR